MSKFKNYHKSAIQPMRPYVEGEQLPKNVSISEADKANGSPKKGDMIAVNPNNPEDMWLVAEKFFLENYEEHSEDERVLILDVSKDLAPVFEGLPVNKVDSYHVKTGYRKQLHKADLVIIANGDLKILKNRKTIKFL